MGAPLDANGSFGRVFLFDSYRLDVEDRQLSRDGV